MPCAACFQLNVHPGKNSFHFQHASFDCTYMFWRLLGIYQVFFVLSWKIFNFFCGVRNPRPISRKRPYKQGEKFRLWSHQTDSFLCRQETFSCIVWTPIWYVTLHFKRSARCSFARYRKRAKSAFLFVNRSLIRYGFYAGAKAIRFCVNIASDCQTEDKIPPKIWQIDQLYQMAGVTKHATRIVFFFTKSIVCLDLDSSWHLLQVCWRRKTFLARFGKEGSLAGKFICRDVHNMEFNYKQFGDVISSLTFTHIQQCDT